MSKIYIENSKFKEFQSEMAEMLTNLSFPPTRKITYFDEETGCWYWTDEAQGVFDGYYDQVEEMLAAYMDVHDESTKNLSNYIENHVFEEDTRRHEVEPTDNKGHSVICVKCGKEFNIENDDWSDHHTEICPSVVPTEG